MNRLFLLVGLLFIFIMPQAWGAPSQYPDPNRVTMWNSLTDSVHTMGQTPQQAKLTRMKFRSARALSRINSDNQDAKAKRLAHMKAWQAAQNSSN